MATSAMARLAPLLRAQFGVFSSRQAGDVGVHRQQIARLRQRGELVDLYPGVHAATAFPDSWERRAIAAQLAGGERAVISHRSAARIHDLAYCGARRSPQIELTYPTDHRWKGAPVVVHESDVLDPEEDVTHVGPFRVTTVAFTLGGLALRLGPHGLARAVDAAVAGRKLDLAALRDLAVRMWHVPGVVPLRMALDLAVPGAELTRSDRERLFLRICATFDLPLPEINVRVIDAAGRRRYVDLLYRAWSLVIEIDCHPSHGRTIGRRADAERQNSLMPRFTVLRFDDHDLLHRPDQVGREVRRALHALGADV